MNTNDREALDALTTMLNSSNMDTMARQKAYASDADRPGSMPFVDSAGTAESIIGRDSYSRYLRNNPKFFDDRKLSKEEMERARIEAETARDKDGVGYGFAGFVETPTEEKKRMDAEREEIKAQQNAILSESKKTNELLAQLVVALSKNAQISPQHDSPNTENEQSGQS